MGIKRLHRSPLINRTYAEINDIEELHEGAFPINIKLIQKCQRVEPSITAKYKMVRTIRVISVEVVIDLVKTKMFHTLSLFGMYQKSFISCRNRTNSQ